jgi:hypothetical protein
MTQDETDRDRLIAFARGKLSREESLRVLEEVEDNEQLSRELEEVLLLMRATEEQERSKEESWRRGVIREPVFRYLFRVAAVLVVAFASVFAVSELTKNRYHDLATVDDSDFSVRWRGEVDEGIELARREYNGGDHDAAIGTLERIIQARPAGESMAVIHWMAAAMLLKTAERSVWGLFPRYEESRIARAMAHLDIAMGSNNLRIQEETHWLRMKSYLMLNRPVDAAHEGEEVVRMGGGLSKGAALLLGEIYGN